MSIDLFKKPKDGYLNKKDEIKLFEDLQIAKKTGNEKEEQRIKNLIVYKFSNMISRIVYRFKAYGIDREELLGEGLYGLTYAINGFNLEKNCRFSTYAYRCVLYLLLSYINKNYTECDMSKNKDIKKIFFKVKKIVAELSHKYQNNELTREAAEEIAKRLDVSVDNVEWVYWQFDNARFDVATERVVGHPLQSNKISPILEPINTPEDFLNKKENEKFIKELLNEAIDGCLNEREKYIYTCSKITKAYKKMTLKQIGLKYNLTAERVRQIRDIADAKVGKRLKILMRERNIKVNDLLSRAA